MKLLRIHMRHIPFYVLIGLFTSILQGVFFNIGEKVVGLQSRWLDVVINILAYLACIPINYVLNWYFTWKSRRSVNERLFARFGLFLGQSAGSLAINQGAFLIAGFFVSSKIAVWIGIGVSSSWGYLFSFLYTFAKIKAVVS